MKTARKVLMLVLCAALLVSATVMGTLAYLTDDDSVTNTFTVGSIAIELDEAKVDTMGTPEGEDRWQPTKADPEQEYHLLPGHTYTKDPTVTVLEGSEECYVRMLVTVNFSSQLDEIFKSTGADLTSIFQNYDASNWDLVGNQENTTDNTRTYEFRYVGAANKGSKDGTVEKAKAGDIVLDDLFESIKVPGEITKEQLATLVTKDNTGKITNQFKINVVAHAIQADGFANADAAWDNF